MRTFDDSKREQFKNIKIRIAYAALAEEFARHRKKLLAKRKHKRIWLKKRHQHSHPITSEFKEKSFR